MIAKTFAFEGALLSKAVAATFAQRQTPLPETTPIALTSSFATDTAKQTQWAAFLKRTEIAMAPAPFVEVIAFLQQFAAPMLNVDAQLAMRHAQWAPGGPWRLPA